MANPVATVVFFLCLGACLVDSITSEAQYSKRGFRNSPLSTARGFGKRTSGEPFHLLSDLGLEKPELNSAITTEWFVEQLIKNPALAKFIVDKTVDLNGDGYISQDELYQVL